MKKFIVFILIITVSILSTDAIVLAAEYVDRGSSAYYHTSRDFKGTYDLIIKTRTDGDNMETDTSCHLSNSKSGGTQSTITANTFESVTATVNITRRNGGIVRCSDQLYRVDQIIVTANLGTLQFASATEHFNDGTAYNYQTDSNEVVTDISVYYY